MALALLEHFSSSLKEGPKGGTKPKGGTGLNHKPFLLSSAMASVAKSKGAGVDASPRSPFDSLCKKGYQNKTCQKFNFKTNIVESQS